MSGSKVSTIDYMLADSVLLSQTETLKVLPFLEGDHFPLHLQVSFKNETIFLKTIYPAEISALERPGCRVKWTPMLESKLKEILDTENPSLHTYGARNFFNSEDPLSKYEQILQRLKPHLFNISEKRPTKLKIANKPWFDHTCVLAKIALQNAYKTALTSDKSGRQQAYLSVRTLKKEYKALIARQKKVHSRKCWSELITAAKTKNQSVFWKLVISGSYKAVSPLTSHIPPDCWVTFFQSMYEDVEHSSQEYEIGHLAKWPPVSVTEVKSYINQLKKAKAPGPDGILPEMLKIHVDWWAPF